MSLLSFCREFLKQCRYNVQYVFGLQDYAEDYAVLDSCKHLDQTCRDWGRKKNTVSSECYLSGYHPTQSYLIQPHPQPGSSTLTHSVLKRNTRHTEANDTSSATTERVADFVVFDQSATLSVVAEEVSLASVCLVFRFGTE